MSRGCDKFERVWSGKVAPDQKRIITLFGRVPNYTSVLWGEFFFGSELQSVVEGTAFVNGGVWEWQFLILVENKSASKSMTSQKPL